jgi:cell division protein ZapA
MKQLEVTIMGQSYILACPDGHETSLLEAVSSVDREMCAIRDAGKVKARERIAVLAALNLAYALSERESPSTTRGSTAAPSAVQATAPGASTVDLSSLMHRLDAALGQDGQLL